MFMPPSETGDWQPYIQVLQRLQDWRCRAVVWDFDFTNEAWNTRLPEFEGSLSNAITTAGLHLAFAARVEEFRTPTNTFFQYRSRMHSGISNMISHLNATVGNVGIGLANLNREHSDGTIRRHVIDKDFGTILPLAIATARLLEKKVGEDSHWINYYGPPGTIPWYESPEVLNQDDLRSIFTNRVVFIGAGPAITTNQHLPDRHKTPFTTGSSNTSSGVEIHATLYSNAVLDEWVNDFFPFGNGYLIAAVGLLSGWYFVKVTPRRAACLALGCAAAVFLFSFFLFNETGQVVPWLVIAAVQMPAAVLVSFLPVKSVFVSYRSATGTTADRLKDGLRNHGIEVYLDINGGQAGALEDILLPEVDKRGNFLLVVTPAMITHWSAKGEIDWVGEEIGQAVQSNKLILPVFVEDIRIAELEALAREKHSELPSYVCTHNPVSFKLKEILASKIRVPYHRDQHDAYIVEIANLLRPCRRRDWRLPDRNRC